MKRVAAMVVALALAAGGAMAANEIVAQIVIKLTSGFQDVQRAVNATHSVSGSPVNSAAGTQTIGTNAAELVTVGDVSVKGWSYWRNLESTNGGNVVALGVIDASTNFLEWARLAAGEYGLIPLGTRDIYALSIGTNAAGTVLEKFIIEN